MTEHIRTTFSQQEQEVRDERNSTRWRETRGISNTNMYTELFIVHACVSECAKLCETCVCEWVIKIAISRNRITTFDWCALSGTHVLYGRTHGTLEWIITSYRINFRAFIRIANLNLTLFVRVCVSARRTIVAWYKNKSEIGEETQRLCVFS